MSLLCARKIGVCGSSKGLDPHAIAFCQALGRRLAQDPLARIISGGTKQRQNARTPAPTTSPPTGGSSTPPSASWTRPRSPRAS